MESNAFTPFILLFGFVFSVLGNHMFIATCVPVFERRVARSFARQSLQRLVLLLCCGVIIFGVFCLTGTANAEGEQGTGVPSSARNLDAVAQGISETMMSPFCPGRTISACPSPQARELRGQIHKWLESGYTEEGVRNQLRTIYGQEIQGTPPSQGWLGNLGWWAPAGFLVLALMLVVVKMRRMATGRDSRNGERASQSGPGRDQSYTDAVEQELQRRLHK